VVEPRLAWETDARQALRRSPGAKRRSEAQRPTPRGGTRWQVGAGPRQPSAPAEEWLAVPVPARRSAATCEAAPSRWDRNGPMARRHQTTSPAGLRGLVSCGQGRRTGGGRPWLPC